MQELKPMSYVSKETLTQLKPMCSQETANVGEKQYFKVVFKGKSYNCSLEYKGYMNTEKPQYFFESTGASPKPHKRDLHSFALDHITPLLEGSWGLPPNRVFDSDLYKSDKT